MSVKLKTITETSWLVISDNDENRVGLLTEIKNNYVLMVKGEKQQFRNKKEVNNYFNEDIFKNVVDQDEPSAVKTDYYIKGFPVDFDNPCEVILKGNNLPLFSKKSTSEVYYSAGYYCLNFPKNWMPAFCPKLSTLTTYEYLGPFKTEMEMKSVLTKSRRERK